MKILLVDDEQSIINGLTTILKTQILFPCKVEYATSGKTALSLISSYLPDLIITDIMMPDCTGLELIRQIKEKNTCNYFIILSGHDKFCFAQEALRYGAFDYLLKPVDQKRLVSQCYEIYKSLPEVYTRMKNRVLPAIPYFDLSLDKTDYPTSLIRILNYMKNNYMNDISQNEIGEELFLHPSYISSLINKYTGYSFTYLLEYFRLTKAAELLLYEKNISISEVSYLVGYNTDRRLYASFQKRLQCTPKQFQTIYKNDFL